VTESDGVARHYLRGVLAANNETNARQAKRPFTNRHNAYPRPGWLNELAKGALSSSDCNNLTPDPNAPTVPVGASGVTPCKVQGGWTFRGHTTYFPQMSPAP
jgi:hypothetical protein